MTVDVATTVVEGVPVAPALRRAERVLWIVGAALAAAVVVMVVVRAVTSDWIAGGDFAVLRIRTLDVGTSETPLVGVYSRYGWNHPGPFVFYALAPFVRIVGGASYGLLLGALAVNLAAVGAALWLARRAGSLAFATFAAVLAVIVLAFGAEELFDPWNPFLPILPLVAAGVAAWRCFDADRVAAVVLVVAASFAAQTHVGSAAMAATMVVVGAVGIVWAGWRAGARVDEGGGDRVDGGPSRRRVGTTALLALGVGLLCWIPPIVQQLHPGSGRGNLRELADFFLHGTEPVVGLHDALVLTSRLFALPPGLGVGWSTLPAAGARIPWLVVLLAGATVWAGRRGLRAALTLDLVAWCAIAAFVVGASRLAGPPFPYLLRWGWVAVVLTWAGILLTLVTAVSARGRVGASWSRIVLAAIASMALLGTLVVGVDMTALDGWSDEVKAHEALIGPTLDALRVAPGPIHLITTDVMIGGTVANELLFQAEQQGLRLGLPRSNAYIFGEGRTVDGEVARTQLIVAPESQAEELVASTGGRVVARDGQIAIIVVDGTQ